MLARGSRLQQAAPLSDTASRGDEVREVIRECPVRGQHSAHTRLWPRRYLNKGPKNSKARPHDVEARMFSRILIKHQARLLSADSLENRPSLEVLSTHGLLMRPERAPVEWAPTWGRPGPQSRVPAGSVPTALPRRPQTTVPNSATQGASTHPRPARP